MLRATSLRPILGLPLRAHIYALRVRSLASSSSSASDVGAGGAGRAGALSAALRSIESAFGKGAVMQLGAAHYPHVIDVVSTGSLSIDAALGVGGLPRGRIAEMYGAESCGKTTVALHGARADGCAGEGREEEEAKD